MKKTFDIFNRNHFQQNPKFLIQKTFGELLICDISIHVMKQLIQFVLLWSRQPVRFGKCEACVCCNNWYQIVFAFSPIYNHSDINSSFLNQDGDRNVGGELFNILTLNVRGPSYLGLTRSISWLLMPWLLTSPGHQQPWYWPCRICRSWSYLRKDFKYMCHINME